MRLTSIQLSRFKTFEAGTVDVTPFTLLIGPNNAGKSTVLQALALLRQSVGEPRIRSWGPFLDLGRDPLSLTRTPESDQAHAGPWELGVQWHDKPAQSRDAERDGPLVGLRACPSADGNSLETCVEVRLRVPSGPLVELSSRWPFQSRPSGTIQVSPEGPFEGFSTDVDMTGHDPFTFTAPTSTSSGPPPPELVDAVRKGQPGAIANYATILAAPYFGSVKGALEAFRYVGPDRAVTQSTYSLGEQGSNDPRTAGDVINTLAYNKQALMNVSERCERVFGYGVDVRLVPQRQVELVATRPGQQPVNAVNLGSGFIQLVWILLQLELSLQLRTDAPIKQVPTTGIEEPELHLHPRAQPEVARILVDYVNGGAQAMCTTQSEHFLVALLQLILEGQLTAAGFTVYYVEDGRLQRLEVDEKGRLAGGLQGFFETNENELLRQMELLLRRA